MKGFYGRYVKLAPFGEVVQVLEHHFAFDHNQTPQWYALVRDADDKPMRVVSLVGAVEVSGDGAS